MVCVVHNFESSQGRTMLFVTSIGGYILLNDPPPEITGESEHPVDLVAARYAVPER